MYGTVSVDNNLVASHDPATAGANHVFSLKNGMLKVEIPNSTSKSTDYELVDGVLSVNPGFTDTITAEYAFTTAPTREIDFEYDHNGLRTQKKVVENGITTIYDYTLHGKLITPLTKRVVDLEGVETSEELHFFYDAQSKPAFVEYSGIKYRYIHNLQGDIVEIVDTIGNPVVEYKYDAWGNPICELPKTGIGAINPFGYRGYVWDTEVQLYYLRNRYYDASLIRFISSDIYAYVGVCPGFSSSNLFVYCENEAVGRKDEDGDFWLTSILVGVAIQYVGDVIGNLAQGKKGADIFKPTSSVGEYVAAGVTALLPGSGVSGAIIGNVISEGITTTEKIIKGEEVNCGEFVENVVTGTIVDLVVGRAANKTVGYIDSKSPKNYSSYAHKVRSRKWKSQLTQEQIQRSMQYAIKANQFASYAAVFGYSGIQAGINKVLDENED